MSGSAAYHGRSLSGVSQPTLGGADAFLSSRPPLSPAAKFVLVVVRRGTDDDGPEARKLVLSNKLAIPDLNVMTMATLRERLVLCARIPLLPSRHVFCTATGEEVVDESMSVAEYMRIENRPLERKAGLPAVSVYYQSCESETKPHMGFAREVDTPMAGVGVNGWR